MAPGGSLHPALCFLGTFCLVIDKEQGKIALMNRNFCAVMCSPCCCTATAGAGVRSE